MLMVDLAFLVVVQREVRLGKMGLLGKSVFEVEHEESYVQVGGAGGAGYLQGAKSAWTKEHDDASAQGFFILFPDVPYREIGGELGGGSSYALWSFWNCSNGGSGGRRWQRRNRGSIKECDVDCLKWFC